MTGLSLVKFFPAIAAIFALLQSNQVNAEKFIMKDIDLPDVSLNLQHRSLLIDNQNRTTNISFPGVNTSNELLDPNDEYFYREFEAAEAIRFASASYCVRWEEKGSRCLKNWNCHASKGTSPLTHVKSFLYKPTNTAGYVGYSESNNRIIVAFAGTEMLSLKNWITNLSVFTVPYEGCADCRVHSGFKNTYLEVRWQVLGLVYEISRLFPTAKLSITGHSLGGALATHMILDLSINQFYEIPNASGQSMIISQNPDYETPETLALSQTLLSTGLLKKITYPVLGPQYTFGAPRLGNAKFSEFFRTNIGATGVFRLTHYRDPVPHVPPLAFLFTHPTREIFYSKNGQTYDVCSISDGEDYACSNQFVFTLNVTDHFLYAGFEIESAFEYCV